MNTEIKSDDIIFNFFKQICDEIDDKKCVELGSNWVTAMNKNIDNMETQLEETDKIKHEKDIENNRQHLNELKNKTSIEWREYAKKCMIEILENKK